MKRPLTPLVLVLSTFASVASAQSPEPPAASEPAPAPAAVDTTPPLTTPGPATAPPSPPLPLPLAPADAAPLAGYHGGLFYLRDKDDLFRLYVQGRVHVDFQSYFGPGLSTLPPDSALKSGFSLRRARTELSGELLEHWQWMFGVDLAPSSTDNSGARTATRDCTIDATTGAQTCSDRVTGVEAAGVRPAPTDVFVNVNAAPAFNVQVGQFLVPFTSENRSSDNQTLFLERSVPVRGIAAPTTRDIGAMVWGELPSKIFYYSAGVYNGDGPNRPNQDNRFDLVGRAIVRPLITGKSVLKSLQVGVSGRAGSRDQHRVGYDVTSLTTQGGYAFWRATYKDSTGRTAHIIPSGDQIAGAVDVFIPVDRFDLTAELIYAASNTREAYDGQQLSPFTQRLGSLSGFGYYMTAGYWIVGDRSIVGYPSVGKPNHVDLGKPDDKPAHGLQVLAKVEQLKLSYHGSSRGGADDAKTPSGDIEARSLSFGVNYWATRHLRFSANYVGYQFPDSAPVSASTKGGPAQTAAQRALAPAQGLVAGVNDEARDNGHTLHEVSLRLAVQF